MNLVRLYSAAVLICLRVTSIKASDSESVDELSSAEIEARRLQEETERHVLRQFFEEIDYELSSYTENRDHCEWSGIGCENGFVTEIDLNDYQCCEGKTIPTIIGKLKDLAIIDLGLNKFEGNLPTEMNELKSLRLLRLHDNYLTGTLPFDKLNKLPSLFRLDLEWNSFTGTIPKEIEDLKNIEYLMIGGNYLTGTLPTERVGKLKLLGDFGVDIVNLVGDVKNESDVCKLVEEGTLENFYMDCGGQIPEVNCECCTYCYDGSRSQYILNVTTEIEDDDNFTTFQNEYLPEFDNDFYKHLLNTTADSIEDIDIDARKPLNCSSSSSPVPSPTSFESRGYSAPDFCETSLFSVRSVSSAIRVLDDDEDYYSDDEYYSGDQFRKRSRNRQLKMIDHEIKRNNNRHTTRSSRRRLGDQAVECSTNLAGKLCYVVDSLILVEHHPSYYTRKSAETVVLPDAIDFVEDRGRYIGSSVRNENEDIKISLKGVRSKMNEAQLEVFEDSVVEFLNQNLLTASIEDGNKPIKTNSAIVQEQSISGDTVVATTTVNGEYIPPPDIEFGAVVTDAFNDDGDEFIEILKVSEEPYFSDVTDVSASYDSGSELTDGMIAAIVISILVVVGLIGVYLYIRHKRVKRSKERDEAGKKYHEERVAKQHRRSAQFRNIGNLFKGKGKKTKEQQEGPVPMEVEEHPGEESVEVPYSAETPNHLLSEGEADESNEQVEEVNNNDVSTDDWQNEVERALQDT